MSDSDLYQQSVNDIEGNGDRRGCHETLVDEGTYFVLRIVEILMHG